MTTRAASLLCIAALSSGCEFTFPGRPSDFPKSVVKGKILLDGRPLPSDGAAWVTFYPEGASLGDAAVGRVNPSGEYRCDNVPVGPVNVRIDVASSVVLPTIIRHRVNRLRGPESPLKITTTKEAATRFDFDLSRSPDPPR